MRLSRSILMSLLVVVLVSGGFFVGRVSADQPHMQAALDHLRLAKVELEKAVADKGGHRVNALKLTNDAITEVIAGIEYERTHR